MAEPATDKQVDIARAEIAEWPKNGSHFSHFSDNFVSRLVGSGSV